MPNTGIQSTTNPEAEGIEFFKKNSDAFAHSLSHKTGEDLNVLIEHLPTSKRNKALDVATGTGFTAMRLAELYDIVIGLDATKEMLNEGLILSNQRHIKNLIFIIGRSDKMPFMDHTFDVVTCRRAAHHFNDREGFIGEVKRVLKEFGTFGFVDMLSPDDDINDSFNQFERLRDETHLSAGTKKYWEETIVKAGFRVEFSEATKEKMTFERWLSPVKPDSPQGRRCREYLESDDHLKAILSYNEDDDSLIKQRLVLTATSMDRVNNYPLEERKL